VKRDAPPNFLAMHRAGQNLQLSPAETTVWTPCLELKVQALTGSNLRLHRQGRLTLLPPPSRSLKGLPPSPSSEEPWSSWWFHGYRPVPRLRVLPFQLGTCICSGSHCPQQGIRRLRIDVTRFQYLSARAYPARFSCFWNASSSSIRVESAAE
jgi:hypothetical protein